MALAANAWSLVIAIAAGCYVKGKCGHGGVENGGTLMPRDGAITNYRRKGLDLDLLAKMLTPEQVAELTERVAKRS